MGDCGCSELVDIDANCGDMHEGVQGMRESKAVPCQALPDVTLRKMLCFLALLCQQLQQQTIDQANCYLPCMIKIPFKVPGRQNTGDLGCW
jgi:hypothetical protein